MSDAIVLASGEMVDIARADAPALLRAAAEFHRRASATPNYLQMLERDNPPPSAPRFDMTSINAVRVDHDWQADEADARTKRAMAQILQAVAEEEAQTQKAKADVHSQFKQRAGSLGRLLTRGFR